jgi:hypothetical protein
MVLPKVLRECHLSDHLGNDGEYEDSDDDTGRYRESGFESGLHLIFNLNPG